jgi:hypothetical protein
LNSLNYNETKRKTNNSKVNVKGALWATTNSMTVAQGLSMAGVIGINSAVKDAEKLTKDEVSILNDSAETILKTSTNLAKKGVEIIDLRPEMVEKASNMPELIVEMIDPIYATAKGKNGAFLNKATADFEVNKIIINKEKFPLAVFHEIGHAFNFNNSKFWKGMQKLRLPALSLSGIIPIAVAFTKTTKPQDGEELTKSQKFMNKFRKIAPTLTFVALLPVLAEETMATIRGQKFASAILDKNLASKVLKSTIKCNISYPILVASTVLATVLAKKIKDKSDTKVSA